MDSPDGCTVRYTTYKRWQCAHCPKPNWESGGPTRKNEAAGGQTIHVSDLFLSSIKGYSVIHDTVPTQTLDRLTSLGNLHTPLW